MAICGWARRWWAVNSSLLFSIKSQCRHLTTNLGPVKAPVFPLFPVLDAYSDRGGNPIIRPPTTRTWSPEDVLWNNGYWGRGQNNVRTLNKPRNWITASVRVCIEDGK